MEKNYITVQMFTDFFNRKRSMYAIGDVRLPAPIPLAFMGWFVGGLIIYSIPLFLFIGIENMSLINLAIILGPPILFASISSKPIFGGRSFLGFLKYAFSYITSPKGWIDTEGYYSKEEGNYVVNSYIWISRRREFYRLAELEDEEKRAKKKDQSNS